MFSRQHRKARILFGLSDVILTTLAFEAAYRTRLGLQLENLFFLMVQTKALVLGFSLLVWVGLGAWLRVYDKLNAGDPRVILRDSLRQCGGGAVCLVLFEYVLKLDLSRPFLFLFFCYAWIALFLFRLAAGRVVGMVRREFARPHFVVVVGTEERAVRLGRMLERSAAYGIRLLGFLSQDASEQGQVRLASSYPLWPIERLRELLCKHVVDEVLFVVSSDRLAELEECFLLCDEEGVRTRVAADFFPHSVSISGKGTSSVPPLVAKKATLLRLSLCCIMYVQVGVEMAWFQMGVPSTTMS